MRKLLIGSRFTALFWTQFLGAFNDNVFKNALVILIAFKSYSLMGITAQQLVALSAGIFILPFFLFSSLAGQLSDKYSKSQLMLKIKMAELAIMLIGSLGFILEDVGILLLTLFFMGAQSTFFGPLKYSSLPELTESHELVAANGMIQMGTFVAILLGTILGGVLSGAGGKSLIYLSLCVLSLAILGIISARRLHPLKAVSPTLKIDFNFLKSTWKILTMSLSQKKLLIPLLGISWFWLLGAMILSILPVYANQELLVSERVVTIFLAIFSIGVGVGSTLYGKIHEKEIRLKTVGVSGIIMSLFLLDLSLFGTEALGELYYHKFTFWRITFDLFAFSIVSGMYIVPLYTSLQKYAQRDQVSQVIAANNILNSFFMVIGSLVLTMLYAQGFNNLQIFFWIALSQALVMIFTIFLYRLALSARND